LGLIREKLAATQGSAIAMAILAMNLEKLLQLLFALFAFWLQILSSQLVALRRNKLPSSVETAAA
ncbi:hypothetical protein KBZ20_07180, partial [Vulcanococcus limneticus Candia 3F8]|jgi:hypothetical protein|nr:hypothetical protein [Vulcanococcus limneticus Candia 3F8]MCP9896502.1 hypothetical protein [Vulcanococcus limneticus Candia 3B3]